MVHAAREVARARHEEVRDGSTPVAADSVTERTLQFVRPRDARVRRVGRHPRVLRDGVRRGRDEARGDDESQDECSHDPTSRRLQCTNDAGPGPASGVTNGYNCLRK